MRSLGALPVVRTGSTVLEPCAEPQETAEGHPGWLQDCYFREIQHDPLFLLVRDSHIGQN